MGHADVALTQALRFGCKQPVFVFLMHPQFHAYLGPPKYAFFVLFGPKAPFGANDAFFLPQRIFAYFVVLRNQDEDEKATLPDPKAKFPDQKATFADHVLARF